MTIANTILWLCLWGASVPALLGGAMLAQHTLSFRALRRLLVTHATALPVLTLIVIAAMLRHAEPSFELEGPALLTIGHWQFRPAFLVDTLSLTYLGLLAIVYPVIVRFSLAAMVREDGAMRYWFLVTLFAGALVTIALSGSVDTLYLGWELVGITSVMLIAFFRRSVRSNENSLRTLVYYRFGDLCLLGAAIEIHHAFPDGHFSAFAQDSVSPLAVGVAFALLGATLAKSAQLPFSPWLHRAMEGPAASSGVFYGALSVHLGPFLLLRTFPLWQAHSEVRAATIGVGALTAVYATLVGRTRPDAKTTLAYATMTQVGVIFVEIGLGLRTLAMIHLCAHAGLRSWQFLRSSSLIQDFQDNPLFHRGVQLQRATSASSLLPVALQRRLYLAAMKQFWVDRLQWELVARPLLASLRALSRLTDRLPGVRTERGRDPLPPAIAEIAWWSLLLGGAVLLGQSGEHASLTRFLIGTVALLHGGFGLVHRSALRVLAAIVLSQLALVVAGALTSHEGRAGSLLMLLGMLAGGAVLGSVTLEVQRRFGVCELAADNGLAGRAPELSRAMLVMGWFFVGLPGGVSFFAEDLIFHALLERSPIETLGFLITSSFNAIAFYRLYLGLFTGVPRPEIPSGGARRVGVQRMRMGVTALMLLAMLTPTLLQLP